MAVKISMGLTTMFSLPFCNCSAPHGHDRNSNEMLAFHSEFRSCPWGGQDAKRL